MNFKVKCTRVKENVAPRFTVGKVYEVRDGKLFADKSCRFESWGKPHNGNGDFEALRKWFKDYYEFELVEEHKTKYKAGDKVRVRSDLTNNLHLYKMENPRNNGWCVVPDMVDLAGKVVTITEYSALNDGYRVAETKGLLWTDEMFEGLAEEKKYKFKVGDKVIGNHPTKYTFTRKGWKGIVTKIHESGMFTAKGYGNENHNHPFNGLDPEYFDLNTESDQKIVITHDGKTTTATMYCDDGTKKVATARCAPEDTFDFNIGAKLAMDRLMEYVKNSKYTVVQVRFARSNRSYHYKTKDTAAKVGMKIIVPVGTGTGNRKIECEITNVVSGDHYIGTFPMSDMKEIQIEEVKLYNGKVVCTNDGGIPNHLTVGKIYTFVNGNCENNIGGMILAIPAKHIKDLNSRASFKFLEIVE